MNSVFVYPPHALISPDSSFPKPVTKRWSMDVKQPRRLPTPLDGVDVIEYVDAMATGLLNEFFKERA